MWKRTVVAATLCLLVPACKDTEQNESRMVHTSNEPAPDLTKTINRLGGETSLDEKQAACQALLQAQKAAIPYLIATLGDEQTYELRDIANRTNLPVFEEPPEPLLATITVGDRCEELLYEIITPEVDLPEPYRSKVFTPSRILHVWDWNTWWHKNASRSLEEIHESLKPLVLRYWQEHGTTQMVDEDPIEAAPMLDNGFPVPPSAQRNEALGGATSLGPGRNFELHVYETDSSLQSIASFYDQHLPDAQRDSKPDQDIYTIATGSVTLTRTDRGTRISLKIGPR